MKFLFYMHPLIREYLSVLFGPCIEGSARICCFRADMVYGQESSSDMISKIEEHSPYSD
jgi:hypothetical protein